MNTSNQRRSGFTIAELLVVVTIIGMLAALLTPAVMQAVSTARKAACSNYLGELVKATIAFDLEKGRLPGVINKPSMKNAPAGEPSWTWPVILFPKLGRGDLWDAYRDQGTVKYGVVQVQQLMCPSDVDAPIKFPVGGMSYVANSTLFRDRSAGDGKNDVSITVIKASAATPLFTERLATMADGTVATGPWAGTPGPTPDKLVFTWPASGTIDSQPAIMSSNHRGGVNVGFCDGSVQFIINTVDASVYKSGP